MAILVITSFHKLCTRNFPLITWDYYINSIWTPLILCPSVILTRINNLKNYFLLLTPWLLSCLVLTAEYKVFFLKSYLNFGNELAIKSLDELIKNPKIEFYHDRHYQFIENKVEMVELKSRNSKEFSIEFGYTNDGIKLFRDGKAVIICQTSFCNGYQYLYPHLKLSYTNDHYYSSFAVLQVRKEHSHAKQILKL